MKAAKLVILLISLSVITLPALALFDEGSIFFLTSGPTDNSVVGLSAKERREKFYFATEGVFHSPVSPIMVCLLRGHSVAL